MAVEVSTAGKNGRVHVDPAIGKTKKSVNAVLSGVARPGKNPDQCA